MKLEQIAQDAALSACLNKLRAEAADSPRLIAIDGRSGSGKTTLAALLAERFGARVVHMDDFFLPASRKTSERLAQAGGNVDIERVTGEVIAPLLAGRAARYQPFDCHAGRLRAESVTIPARGLVLIEGSYSMHPLARAAYAAAVFLRVTPEIQRARILARNGEAMLRRFETEWIPLEEAYFSACGVEAACVMGAACGFAFDVTD